MDNYVDGIMILLLCLFMPDATSDDPGDQSRPHRIYGPLTFLYDCSACAVIFGIFDSHSAMIYPKAETIWCFALLYRKVGGVLYPPGKQTYKMVQFHTICIFKLP